MGGPDDLADSLTQLSTNVVKFSSSMRSLYAEKRISSDVYKAGEINALRDSTRRAANMYLKNTFPSCESLVESISGFFDYYDSFDFTYWQRHLSSIVEEAGEHKMECAALVKEHEDILGHLKKKEDKAKVLVQEFEGLSLRNTQKEVQLRDLAAKKRALARDISLYPSPFPIIDVYALIMLEIDSYHALGMAAAVGSQNQGNKEALDTVKNVFLPSLQAFIRSLEAIAGFFSNMKMELSKFEKRGSSAKFKEMHYDLMRASASKIKQACIRFNNACPAVRSNFQAIN